MSRREWALAYAALGIRVFRIWDIVDGVCECQKLPEGHPRRKNHPLKPDGKRSGSPGKHPVFGQSEATTDPEVIGEWWPEEHPDAWSIGAVPGPGSGYFVLDVDPRSDGDASLKKLVEEHGEDWTKTVTSLTGGGGAHLCFKYPDGGDTRAWRKDLSGVGYPGLDILHADEPYDILPPSRHESGNEYEWHEGCAPGERMRLDAPEWLLELVTKGADSRPSRAAGTPGERARSTYPPASPELIEEVREKLRQHGPSVYHQKGDGHAVQAGMIALNDWGLPWEEAEPLALEWNEGCRCPARPDGWAPDMLEKKWHNGLKSASGPYGAERDRFEGGRSFGEKFGRWPVPVADEQKPTEEPGLPNPEQPARNRYASDLREYLGDGTPRPEEDKWIVPNIVPRGVPWACAGGPKSAKTLLMLWIALHVASGRALWGRYKVRRARVMVLPLEDTTAETCERIWAMARAIGIDPRDLHEWLEILPYDTNIALDCEADMLELDARIAEWKPELILMDSLARLHGADENDASKMRAVTRAWGALSKKHNVSCGIIHHVRKEQPGAKDARSAGSRMRGTGDIHALVRHVVGVRWDERSDVREIECSGNACAQWAFDVAPRFRRAPGGEQLIDFLHLSAGAPQAEAVDANVMQTREVERHILLALTEAGKALNAKQLAEATKKLYLNDGERTTFVRGKTFMHIRDAMVADRRLVRDPVDRLYSAVATPA